MKCKDCPYSWINGHWEDDESGIPEFISDESYPSCHYEWNDGQAPCEV